MELRWYWRILRRQVRIIWITTAIVAVLAALYTAYGYTGASYKAQVTIQFYAPLPILLGSSNSQDPQGMADASASAARDVAKEYSGTIPYFKNIANEMKARYNQTIPWQTVAASFGATSTGYRQILLEYTGNNAAVDQNVLRVAIDRLQNDFLPAYHDEYQAPAKSNVITFPVQMNTLSAVDGKPASKSTLVLSWLLKALIGVVLGIVLAFLWEYIDESIHDEQDVRSWMHTPTLGVIPGGKSARLSSSSRKGVAGEGFRSAAG